MKNQKEINRRQRERRKQNHNNDTRVYEKTLKGFLMRLYRNIESRIKGIQKSKHHLYQEKTITFSREEFYTWALNNSSFWNLYNNWITNQYIQKFTPSIDRLDSSKGYSFDNIEWVTHSENSRRGAISKNKKAGYYVNII